jgi:hypothetical protein
VWWRVGYAGGSRLMWGSGRLARVWGVFSAGVLDAGGGCGSCPLGVLARRGSGGGAARRGSCA